MPLYGLAGRPEHSDIDQVVSYGGWYEAFAAALTDVDSKIITNHLRDCEDGTVNVTLFQGSPDPAKTFNVNKREWGSSTNNVSVAWPAALFDGLKKLSPTQNSSQTNSQTVIAQAIVGVYADSTTTSCQIAPAPAPNPYQMTTKLPIIAYMRGAGTDASIAGRYLHVMAYNATSENGGDFVSIDTASIPGAGSGTKNLSLSEWDGDCLFLSMPPLS